MDSVPATDIEHAFVAAQLRQVKSPNRVANGRVLEAIERLTGGEVRVRGVLNSGEVSPVDEPIGHSSQTTLP